MKTSRKRILLIIGAFVSLIVITIVYFTYITGELNIKGTILTEYHDTDNPEEHTIETQYFKITTPNNWIHIFSGHGEEGDPYGLFLTGTGAILYEYGMWAPDYSEDNDIYGYVVSNRKVGRFKLNIAKNDKNEIGIAIPPQHEMKTHMTFYMDEAVTNNFEELIEGIKLLEFKDN